MKWIPSCLRYSNLLTVCTTTVVIAASVSVSLVTIPRDIRPRIQSQISGKGSRAQRPELRNKRIYIPSVQGVKREDLELKLNSISCPCQECVDICLHQISHHYLFRMKPTRCTLLLSTFISTSVHVSGNYVPIIRRNFCIHATLSGRHQLNRQPPIHCEKYQCRIDTVSSADDGHSCPKHVENLK